MTLTGFPQEFEEFPFLINNNFSYKEKVKLLADVTHEVIPETDYSGYSECPELIKFEIYRTKDGAILCNKVIITQSGHSFVDSKICTDDHEINEFFKKNTFSFLSSVESNLRKELYILAGISITNIAA